MKTSLCSTDILGYPSNDKTFILDTDASGYAVGSVLSQIDKDKKIEKVIQYASRLLTPVEQKYSTTRKELLSVILSLKKIQAIFTGKKIYYSHWPSTAQIYKGWKRYRGSA